MTKKKQMPSKCPRYRDGKHRPKKAKTAVNPIWATFMGTARGYTVCSGCGQVLSGKTEETVER